MFISCDPPLLEPDSESSTIEEAAQTPEIPVEPSVDTPAELPESKIVDFPDLNFEPAMNQEDEDSNAEFEAPFPKSHSQFDAAS